MISNTTYIAQTRFGLGMRPDEISAVENDPTGWLLGQIRSPQMTHVSFSELSNSQTCLREAYELREKRKEMKQEGGEKVKVKQVLKETFVKEMQARLQLAISTSTPFYERLVAFWSNHFSVSAKKGFLLGVVGAYEREAIRPYVTGKFSDMLLAVVQHPVMLAYLDNAQSIGPNSFAGERRGKGLNENLAREIMELHTLGVDGGYTQADVTSFAKVITGWSIGGPNSPNPGVFDFAPRRHEPGVQTIMGKQYSGSGQEQGVEVLHDLAANPATARHIAFKLARHFVSDTPPQEVVDKLAAVFMESGGMLPPLYEALVNTPQCWDATANPKVKSTYDLIVSAMRLTAKSEEDMMQYCMRSMKFLGNIPFTAESPAGFPDTAQDMLGPEALMRRVEWAQMTGRRFTLAEPAASLAGRVMGPVLSADSRSALAGAKSEMEASAILLGSPEFQRR